MKLPIIITPRLVLRPLAGSDGPAIAEATNETWEDLSQWMRWAIDRERLTNVSDCQKYAESCQASFLKGEDFTFGGFLKDTNDFVLISRLAFAEKEMFLYEFCGYWCRKKYQGRGYMKEAVNAIARYAFTECSASNLKITHGAGNDKTRSVMDSLGFKEINILKDAHKLPNGTIVDEYVLALSDVQKLPPLEVTW